MKQGLLIAAASVAMLATPAIASADDTEGWYLRANLGYGTHQDIDLEGDVTSDFGNGCLLYTSPSPRDGLLSRMPSSA